MGQLIPFSVKSTGFYGINKQAASVADEIMWAMDAINCVVDRYGRMASRKGWKAVTTSALTNNPPINTIAEYIHADGTTEIISAGNGNIYTGTTTLTSLISGFSANNWKFVNFNKKIYAFQRGYDPLVYDGSTMKKIVDTITKWSASTAVDTTVLRVPSTSNGYYYHCTTSGTTGSTEPSWPVTIDATVTDGTAVWTCKQIPQANDAVGAYGRLWVCDTPTNKTTVWYSDLLIGNAFSGGSSGAIDLSSVWTQGSDALSTIVAFNNYIYFMGSNSIITYQNPIDPINMSLYDVTTGIGSIARDSVKDIGTDMLFLSKSGIRSLGRTVIEKSQPLTDISKNVRDELLAYLLIEDLSQVRAIYHEPEGLYVLFLPKSQVCYCFDVRFPLEDQSLRVTYWTNINPYCAVSSKDQNLYFGKDGVIGKYDGYQDNGKSYPLIYRTNWMDFGQPSVMKILKEIVATIVGAVNTNLSLKWAFDYQGTYASTTLTAANSNVSEYGVAQYNLSEYSQGVALTTIRKPLSKSGKVVQFGFETDVNGTSISIQKFDIYAKPGKMY